MNFSTSDCSSGAESGWTTYFDQISNSTDQYNKSMPPDQYVYRSKGKFGNRTDEEDDDLSMISDASSGPPHFRQDEEVSAKKLGAQSKLVKNKKKAKEHRKTESMNFHLDDTASSPAYNFTKNNAALEHDKSLNYYHPSAVSTTHPKEENTDEAQIQFLEQEIELQYRVFVINCGDSFRRESFVENLFITLHP